MTDKPKRCPLSFEVKLREICDWLVANRLTMHTPIRGDIHFKCKITRQRVKP